MQNAIAKISVRVMDLKADESCGCVENCATGRASESQLCGYVIDRIAIRQRVCSLGNLKYKREALGGYGNI